MPTLKPLHGPFTAILLLVLVLVLATPTAGQVSELIEVSVVNVDAFVSDRRGNPVSGLERADFEVLLDGVAVPIVNFYAAKPPAVTAPQKGANATPSGSEASQALPLQLAILIDSSNVETHARNEALKRVRDFLRAHLDPGDLVMLASTPTRKATNATAGPDALTDRLDLIERTLDDIMATPAQNRRSAEFHEILQDIGASLAAGNASVRGRMRSLQSRIDAFAAEASRDTERVAAALRRLVDRLADLPGRTAILYLGGGLSLHPGAALSGALSQALGRYATLLPEGARMPDLPSQSPQDDSGELRGLARYASIRNVAFYAVPLGRSTPTASATLFRGSREAGAGSAPGQEESWAPTVNFSRQFDLESSLQLLAGATGGRLANGRNVNTLLGRLLDDAQAFYSLGIQPPEGDSGKLHHVEVRVRGRGREVRHREAFRTVSRAEEAVTEALTSPDSPPSPPIVAATGTETPPLAVASTDATKDIGRRSEKPRKKNRKVRLPVDATAAGYLHTLRLLADGQTPAARQALRELETEATRQAAYDQLEKIESQVLLKLAETSPGALLPVALLHADLLQVYRQLGLAPLAEHARRMSIRLAKLIAQPGSTLEARSAASQALTELASDLLRAGRQGECEALFELALDAAPDNAVARLGLAVSHERFGRYEQAVAFLGPLVENDPSHAEARLRLALNLERLGKTDRSRPLLDTLLEAQTDWIAILAVEETVRIAILEVRFDQATSILDRALERWPSHPSLQIQHAFLLDRGGAAHRARDRIHRLVTASTAELPSPRDRYNRWPIDGGARRELRASAGRWLGELKLAVEAAW